MEEKSTRRMALDVLSRVWQKGDFLSVALDEEIAKNKDLTSQLRAYLTRLCMGTEEKLIFLDEVIEHYSSVPVKKIRPVMLYILRISVYQIFFMESAPDHAIVNEAVTLAKKRGLKNLSGFVNGILRSVLRDGRDHETMRKKLLTGEDIHDMSVSYSIPAWIVESFISDYGKETCEKICEGLFEPSATYAWAKDGSVIRIDDSSKIGEMDAFKNGDIYIMDRSSMQPVLMADIKEGDLVLDVCAAPGGKSLLAASRGAKVESRDLTDDKIKKIHENIIRMHMGNVTVKKWDATIDDPDCHGKYDVVIADLPCSGLGVMAKKPDIRYRLKKEDIASLAGIQRKILDVVSSYVKKGGKLVFSTCTLSRAENEDNVDYFLKGHGEFKLEEEKQIIPEAGGHDGFFVAVFKNGS